MLHKARNLIVGAWPQSGDIVDAVRNPLGTSGAYNHIVQIGTLLGRLEQQAQVETVIQASHIENDGFLEVVIGFRSGLLLGKMTGIHAVAQYRRVSAITLGKELL